MTYKPSFHGTSIVRNGTIQHNQTYLPNSIFISRRGLVDSNPTSNNDAATGRSLFRSRRPSGSRGTFYVEDPDGYMIGFGGCPSSKVVRALFLISWFPKTPIANSYFGLITTTESKWPFPSSSVTGLVGSFKPTPSTRNL